MIDKLAINASCFLGLKLLFLPALALSISPFDFKENTLGFGSDLSPLAGATTTVPKRAIKVVVPQDSTPGLDTFLSYPGPAHRRGYLRDHRTIAPNPPAIMAIRTVAQPNFFSRGDDPDLFSQRVMSEENNKRLRLLSLLEGIDHLLEEVKKQQREIEILLKGLEIDPESGEGIPPIKPSLLDGVFVGALAPRI